MSFVTYSCRTCGAGIDVQPDNLLTICEYCGDIHPAKDIGEVPVHIVPSRSRDEVIAAVNQRMAQDRDMRGVRYEIGSAEGVYVPIYVNHAYVRGRWEGYKTRRQNKTTIKEPRSGAIDQRGDFPVPARKHAHEFGLAQLGRVLFRCQPVPFRTLDWKSIALPVLAVDMDESEADALLSDNLIDLIGEQIRAAHSLDGITRFEADRWIQSRFILLYPLWTVIYTYRGGSYRVAVEGGTPSVLAAMEPVFLSQRIGRFLATIGLTVTAGLIWYGSWWVLFVAAHDSDEMGKLFIGVIVAILAAMTGAWHMAGKMVASVNVEGIADAQMDGLKGQTAKLKALWRRLK